MIVERAEQKWLYSCGGNLVLTAYAQAANSHFFPDAVLDNEEYVALVPTTYGMVISLGGEPLPTFLHGTDTVGYVIRSLRYALPTFAPVISCLSDLAFVSDGVALDLPNGVACVFDAHKSYEEPSACFLLLRSGTYTLSTCHYLPDPFTYVIVHRLMYIEETL
jgi:hypothetical protein